MINDYVFLNTVLFSLKCLHPNQFPGKGFNVIILVLKNSVSNEREKNPTIGSKLQKTVICNRHNLIHI